MGAVTESTIGGDAVCNGIFAGDDPFAIAAAWLAEAERSEPNDANAIALATVDAAGLPNVRMVLLKDADERGFVFYTNYESQKRQEILGTMKAALCFHWKSLRRQVRIRGVVEEVSKAEADAYFASRPRDSRIGAWASQQTRPLESRFALETAVALNAAKYAIGEVPRPPYWSGIRVKGPGCGLADGQPLDPARWPAPGPAGPVLVDPVRGDPGHAAQACVGGGRLCAVASATVDFAWSHAFQENMNNFSQPNTSAPIRVSHAQDNATLVYTYRF